jgi:hypothetical protein
MPSSRINSKRRTSCAWMPRSSTAKKKKKTQQFWTLSGGVGLGLAPSQKDVRFREYETGAGDLRSGTAETTPRRCPGSLSAPPVRILPDAHLGTPSNFFHRKRILSGPYIPEGWSNADHGLETIYLMKRPHASDGKNRNGKRPFQPSTGLSHRNPDTGIICRR